MTAYSEEMDLDNTITASPIIERVPHFGNIEKKRCYDILQDILNSDELQQDVSRLSKKRRRQKTPVTIVMPRPAIEVKMEDSGVASSVISTRGAASTGTSSTDPVEDAILPEDYIRNNFDFEDTYRGPFWKPPSVQYDGIYLVMVNTRSGETWVQARFIEQTGPICTVRIINTQKQAKIFTQFFAIAEEAPLYLKIGQRVIAPFRRFTDTGEVRRGRKTYKLGTVTEYPAVENNHRYLIFFDSGDWGYINMEDVRPLLHSRKHAWRDVPAPHKFALHLYLKRQFLPMVHFESRQTVKMQPEKVGRRKFEFLCRNSDDSYTVLSVDCSLVALYHRIDRTTFLMHRGYPFLVKLNI